MRIIFLVDLIHQEITRDTLIILLTNLHNRLTSERETIALEHLLLDKNIYRKITKIAYSENKPVERVVNHILREYIDVFFPLRKIGLVHVTTDTIKMIFQDISDELIIDHAKSLSKRYMEVITLLSKNRTLDDYLDFFKLYANASGYQMEVTTNQSGGKRVIMRFNLGRKYSLYLGECFKILLSEVSTVHNYDFTDSVVFFECSPSPTVVRTNQQNGSEN
jgi:hypothetical protein